MISPRSGTVFKIRNLVIPCLCWPCIMGLDLLLVWQIGVDTVGDSEVDISCWRLLWDSEVNMVMVAGGSP